MCLSLWIAWLWGSQRHRKQHRSFESVNLINLINNNQESEIHVKTWQIREAEEQPQLLPTSSVPPSKRGKILSPPCLTAYLHFQPSKPLYSSANDCLDPLTPRKLYSTVRNENITQPSFSLVTHKNLTACPYYWWHYMLVHHSSFVYAQTMLKHACSACLQWFSTCSIPGQS